jgi:hypothetical protein
MVEGKNDIIGHIAYSIYKEEKINHVKKKKEELGEVTDETLKSFHEISSYQSSIDSYRIKAEIFMQAFFENTFQEMKEDIENQTIENQTEILKNIITPLTPSFWTTLKHNVLAGLTITAILALLVLVINFTSNGFWDTVGKMFDLEIQPKTEQTE